MRCEEQVGQRKDKKLSLVRSQVEVLWRKEQREQRLRWQQLGPAIDRLREAEQSLVCREDHAAEEHLAQRLLERTIQRYPRIQAFFAGGTFQRQRLILQNLDDILND